MDDADQEEDIEKLAIEVFGTSQHRPRGAVVVQERIVDKRGRLQLGRAFAGRQFEVTTLPDGDILLRAVPDIPENERWLHTPEMKAKLLRAHEWVQTHPPEETDLDKLLARALKR